MYQSLSAASTALIRAIPAALFALSALIFFNLAIPGQESEPTDDAVAAFNLAQEAHEKGDLPVAIQLYEKALKIVPEFPEAQYQRGMAELALGNTVEAERSFRRAVELRPEWTLALAGLGSILVDREQFSEAERVLTRAIDLDPQNFPAFSALVDLRLRTGAAPAVLRDLLTRLIDITSKAKITASTWTARAALENALGDGKSASASLARAITIDPGNRAALLQVANMALADGDTLHALEAADALARQPANADEVKLLRARILAYQGKTDEALKVLDTIAMPSARAADLRGKITANTTVSAAELETQLETQPTSAVVLGRLCTVLRVSDPAKALGYCRRAAEAEPANINHAIGFGAALVQAKQFDAAVNILQKIVGRAPDNWTAHANLATALFELQRFAEAKTQYEWLTSTNPGSAAAFYFLAIVHDHLSEYLDSMANYQQYLRLADPVRDKLEIDKVNLRIPTLAKQIKAGKGKK